MTLARNALLALVALASAALSATALAVPNKVCPNCTEAQMYSAARAAGLGTLYVWNPYANGLMKKYATYCGSPAAVTPGQEEINQFIAGATEATGICGSAPMTTEELPVEAAYLQAAPHLATAYIASGGTFQFGADLTFAGPAKSGAKSAPAEVAATPPGPPRGMRVDTSQIPFAEYYPRPISIQDYYTDANLRAQIQDYIRINGLAVTNNILRTALEFLGAHFDAYTNFTSGVVIRYELVFFDGATLVITYTLGLDPVYVKDSGRDGAGKLVPEGNAREYAGRWTYTSDQDRFFRDLLGLIQRYNIPVTGPQTYRSMSCTWDGSTLRCVLHP
jgi:hypothetical protein